MKHPDQGDQPADYVEAHRKAMEEINKNSIVVTNVEFAELQKLRLFLKIRLIQVDNVEQLADDLATNRLESNAVYYVTQKVDGENPSFRLLISDDSTRQKLIDYRYSPVMNGGTK